MTKEKYAEIKSYVLSRLASVDGFVLTPLKFCEMFQLKHPYYREFEKAVAEDGSPFRVESGYYDGFGDPSDPIEFLRISEKERNAHRQDEEPNCR